MAKTKYSFEKRQKEIARQKKQEEKRARRAENREQARSNEAAAGGEAPLETDEEVTA